MKRFVSIPIIVALLYAPVLASPAGRASRTIWSRSKNWKITKRMPGPGGKKAGLDITLRLNGKLTGRVADLDAVLDMAWQGATCKLHINAGLFDGSYGTTGSAKTPYVKGTIKVDKVKASCSLPSAFLTQVKSVKLHINLHLMGRRLCPVHKGTKPSDCLMPVK
ncbi:MAG: hypothetical protein J7M25_12660 [Deltaproteobacteria bacterium]|nr:hypothetical protein [Deltaproteobacteria bacterium]